MIDIKMTTKIDNLLDKWYLLKQDIQKQQKIEEQIRTKIKNAMHTKNLKEMTTEKYKVSVCNLSRETLSKNVCPREIWEKYRKKSTFDVVKLTKLSIKNERDDVEDEIDDF